METRGRLGDNYANSFMFGATSTPARQAATPMATRSSPLGTNKLSSPLSTRQQRVENEVVSVVPTTTKKKRPPLSSVLDDAQIGSATPINEQHRTSHQYTPHGANTPHHHLFTGSPPPRRHGHEFNMSIEDPFDHEPGAQLSNSLNTVTNLQDINTGDFRRIGQLPFSSPEPQFRNNQRWTASKNNNTYDSVSMNSHQTLGQFPQHTHSDAGWSHWVLVYGYHVSSVNCDEAILQRFQEYGTIERYAPSSGNWIFIRYEQPAMTERAVSQNGTYFNANTIIAVAKLDPAIAKYMNLQLTSDGSLTQGEISISKIYNADVVNEVTEKASLIQRKTGKRITRGKYEIDEKEAYGADTHAGSVDGDDVSLYLRPYRTKSICTKIVEWFYSY